jgi:prepilin-type N-terminal cleavage/methylation domain-containing protein
VPPPDRFDHGFSLTEMLAALMIAALASLAIVSTRPPPPPPLLAQETSRLAAAVAGLSREAIASGETLGLALTQTGLTRVAWRGGAWQARPDGGLQFADTVRLDTRTAAAPEIGAPETATPKAAPVWPVIRADAAGMVAADALWLTAGTQTRALAFAPGGALIEAAR